MPSLRLFAPHRGISYDMTQEHFWYNNRETLWRLHLKTLQHEKVHTFPAGICDVHCNETQCIVEVNCDGIWVFKAEWKRIATQTHFAILTPSRVVFQCYDQRIMSYDFSTTSVVASGRLLYASDDRVLLENNGHRVWQDGTSAGRVVHLSLTNVEHDEIPEDAERPYYIRHKKERTFLLCDSRTAVCLERLLGNQASQLLKHA